MISAPQPATDLTLDELIAAGWRGRRMPREDPDDTSLHGDLRGKRRGDGLDFENVGPYQPGDDVRRIDWHATARSGRPQIRRFRTEVQYLLMLIVDLRPGMFFASADQLVAKSACLAGARIALRETPLQQRLGWIVLTAAGPVVLPAERGRRARLRQFATLVGHYRQTLERADAERSWPLDRALAGLPARLRGDAKLVLISDFSEPGPGLERVLRDLRPGRLRAVVVEDALWTAAPPDGRYPIRAFGSAARLDLPLRACAARHAGVRQTLSRALDETLGRAGVERIERCTARTLAPGRLA